MPHDPRGTSQAFSTGRLVLFALLIVLVAVLGWDQFIRDDGDNTVEIDQNEGQAEGAALGETADETGEELQDEAQQLDESVDSAEPQTGEVLEDANESDAAPVEEAVEDAMEPSTSETIAPGDEETQGN